MKIYAGNRKSDARRAPGGPITVHENGGVRLLDPRTDLVHHSTSFDWGELGAAGAAQTAFALLIDAFGNEHLAKAIYRKFENDVVARLADEWQLTEQDVIEWIAKRING